MRERPILFSAGMVRAILDGSKTQTRRRVKLRDHARSVLVGLPRLMPSWIFEDPEHIVVSCPYGMPGDRLYVREAFRLDSDFDAMSPRQAIAHCEAYDHWAGVHFEASCPEVAGVVTARGWGRLRPGIHLPRELGRIHLEVTEVRVERLHAITEDDARAEGVKALNDPEGDCWTDGTFRTAFNFAWNEINGWSPNAWDANPFVWVISFRRVKP